MDNKEEADATAVTCFSFPESWDTTTGSRECARHLAEVTEIHETFKRKRGTVRVSILKANGDRFCEKILAINPILLLVNSNGTGNFLWQLFTEELRELLERSVRSVKRVTNIGNAVGFIKSEQILEDFVRCTDDILGLLENVPEKQFSTEDERFEFKRRRTAFSEFLESVDYVGQEQLTEVRKLYMKIWKQELDTSFKKAGFEGTLEVTLFPYRRSDGIRPTPAGLFEDLKPESTRKDRNISNCKLAECADSFGHSDAESTSLTKSPVRTFESESGGTCLSPPETMHVSFCLDTTLNVAVAIKLDAENAEKVKSGAVCRRNARFFRFATPSTPFNI
eukprot:9498071-Pyramimonas_sp.AAC.1